MAVIHRYDMKVGEVLKFTLEKQTFDVVHVDSRMDGWVEFWGIVEDATVDSHYTFQIFGTGHPLPDLFGDSGMTYYGTSVQGNFVWHLFGTGAYTYPQ